jgi:hypothetical protein
MVRSRSSVAGKARTLRALSGSKRAFAAIAIALASGSGLAVAQTPPHDRAVDDPAPAVDRGAGIERARKAGITIDPAIVSLMERAPAGSCQNDPTLAGCPRVKEMIYAPRYFGLSTDDPTANASQRGKRLRARAPRARMSIDQCAIHVTDQSPYKAAGQAQGDYRSYCSTAVSQNDVYIALYKYDLNQQSWRLIHSRWIGNVSRGVTHYYHLANGCASNTTRAWRAQIDGYAVLNGVWYGATQKRDKNLNCNYP